jgi:hypothetical protein
MAEDNTGIIMLAIGGIAAYFYWPQISAALGLPSSTAAATLVPTQLIPSVPVTAQMTNSSPTMNTPGSVPVGTQGCSMYNNLISCPPGVSPPPPAAPINNCQPGYSVDANGTCTLYSDAQLLAGLNSIQWSGLTAIPAEQIKRIDPQILAEYASTTGVNPGTVLAYMLGLGGAGRPGQKTTGSDGNLYTYTNGVWIRPAAGALSGVPGGRVARLAGALPINNNILIKASHDPDTAAMVGNDPRALLTVPQWNYFYGQASGVLQTKPAHPYGQPGAKVNAQTYQQIRRANGLAVELTGPATLGTVRRAARGAFPLGSIGFGPDRVPFVQPGNRTIYRVPGQGLVVSKRMGVITSGGGAHRWARSPFPRPVDWRMAQ